MHCPVTSFVDVPAPYLTLCVPTSSFVSVFPRLLQCQHRYADPLVSSETREMQSSSVVKQNQANPLPANAGTQICLALTLLLVTPVPEGVHQAAAESAPRVPRHIPPSCLRSGLSDSALVSKRVSSSVSSHIALHMRDSFTVVLLRALSSLILQFL